MESKEIIEVIGRRIKWYLNNEKISRKDNTSIIAELQYIYQKATDNYEIPEDLQ